MRPAQLLKNALALSRFLPHLSNLTIARKITLVVAMAVLVAVTSARADVMDMAQWRWLSEVVTLEEGETRTVDFAFN